jgi:hypothetical protein
MGIPPQELLERVQQLQGDLAKRPSSPHANVRDYRAQLQAMLANLADELRLAAASADDGVGGGKDTCAQNRLLALC